MLRPPTALSSHTVSFIEKKVRLNLSVDGYWGSDRGSIHTFPLSPEEQRVEDAFQRGDYGKK